MSDGDSREASTCVDKATLLATLANDLRTGLTLALYEPPPADADDQAIHLAPLLDAAAERDPLLQRTWAPRANNRRAYAWTERWRLVSPAPPAAAAGAESGKVQRFATVPGARCSVYVNGAEGRLCVAFGGDAGLEALEASLSRDVEPLSAAIAKRDAAAAPTPTASFYAAPAANASSKTASFYALRRPAAATRMAPLVQRELQRAYLALRPALQATLQRLEAERDAADAPIDVVYVVGFALGGGLAQLCAVDVATSFAALQPAAAAAGWQPQHALFPRGCLPHAPLATSLATRRCASLFAPTATLKTLLFGAPPVGNAAFRALYSDLCCAPPPAAATSAAASLSYAQRWHRERWLCAPSVDDAAGDAPQPPATTSALRWRRDAAAAGDSDGDGAKAAMLRAEATATQPAPRAARQSPAATSPTAAATAAAEDVACLAATTLALANRGDPLVALFDAALFFAGDADDAAAALPPLAPAAFLDFHFVDGGGGTDTDPRELLAAAARPQTAAARRRQLLRQLLATHHAAAAYVAHVERVCAKPHWLESLARYLRKVDRLLRPQLLAATALTVAARRGSRLVVEDVDAGDASDVDDVDDFDGDSDSDADDDGDGDDAAVAAAPGDGASDVAGAAPGDSDAAACRATQKPPPATDADAASAHARRQRRKSRGSGGAKRRGATKKKRHRAQLLLQTSQASLRGLVAAAWRPGASGRWLAPLWRLIGAAPAADDAAASATDASTSSSAKAAAAEAAAVDSPVRHKPRHAPAAAAATASPRREQSTSPTASP
jgi:hypothetical protein